MTLLFGHRQRDRVNLLFGHRQRDRVNLSFGHSDIGKVLRIDVEYVEIRDTKINGDREKRLARMIY